MQSHISEAVNEIDEFPEIVKEWFVGFFKLLHSDILFQYRFIY
jgi:hypothetical protein